MRISDWSSDVCSSDLVDLRARVGAADHDEGSAPLPRDAPAADNLGRIVVCRAGIGDRRLMAVVVDFDERDRCARARALQQCMERPAITGLGRFAGEHATVVAKNRPERSEEHTSELQSLMRISYAVFCLKKK